MNYEWAKVKTHMKLLLLLSPLPSKLIVVAASSGEGRGEEEGRAKRVKPVHCSLCFCTANSKLQTLNCTQSAHKPKSKSSKGHLRLRGGGGGLVGWWLYKGRASILQPTEAQLLSREHQGEQS